MKNRRSKPTAPKRHQVLKPARRRAPAAAGKETEVARLKHDRDAALERQKATAEILESIRNSLTDAQPVFDAIVRNLLRLFGTRFASVQLVKNGMIEMPAADGAAGIKKLKERYPRPFDEDTAGGQAMVLKRLVQYSPLLGNPAAPRGARQIAREFGYNSIVAAPMIRESKVIGAIVCAHHEPRRFDASEVALFRTFADQAVIAIENARLFNELRQRTDDLTESLEQQTATSEVLKVISRSTFDLQTVLDTLTRTAAKLCAADKGFIFLRDGDVFRFHSHFGLSEEELRYGRETPLRPSLESNTGRVALSGKVSHIHDVLADPEYKASGHQRIYGYRTNLGVPLLRDGAVIGVFALTRDEVAPFNDKQIELVTIFADQAVIAIENGRLFNDLRQRTNDLTESLEQQTATSEVLRVISGSPTDTKPVFDMIAESAWRLCEAQYCFVYRFDGQLLHFIAHHGLTPDVLEMNRRMYPMAPSRKSAAARAVLERAVVQIPEVKADREFALGPMASVGGFGSVVGVPILRDGVPVGSIALTRVQTGLLPERQIELLKTFADQAVIAIENARLFDELRRRTNDLAESLEQQTATSNVLRVISGSPGELAPVFGALLDNAARICEAKFGMLVLAESEGKYRVAAMHGAPPQLAEKRTREPVFTPGPSNNVAIAARTKKVQHVADLRLDPSYLEREPSAMVLADFAGARTLVVVPMLKDNEFVGAFGIYRQEVRPFTDKQIALLENFAAQAVIAIENTRLLNELRESLDQQTATSEVLKVIAGSTGELQPVFGAMLANAARLCEARYGAMWLHNGTDWRAVAMHGDLPPAYIDLWRSGPWFNPGPNAPMPRVAAARRPIHIPDMREDISYRERGALPVSAVEVAGVRTLLCVPMMRENDTIGVITIYRTEVRPFTEKQIELVTNFAAQAVIAIENTRLFNELRERTEDLQESLQQQTATSEVLKVISGSGGELQPVFEALLENATRLCAAKFGNLYIREGDAFRTTAMHNVPEAFAEFRRRDPLVHPEPGSLLFKLLDSKKTVHIRDATKEKAYLDGQPRYVSAVKLGGFRSMIAVPMLKDGDIIGGIIIYRPDVSSFSDKQIELVQNFAAQAVIAIENARLLGELRESLQQQTATADVLKVISRSTFDLQTVLDTLVESAGRLCEADLSNIWRPHGGAYRLAATYGAAAGSKEFLDNKKLLETVAIEPGQETVTGRALLHGKTIRVDDVQADPDYKLGGVKEQRINRSMLGVPLLREGSPIGVITLARSVVKPFTDKQVELVETFADQAVIAIENVRLFEAEQQRSAELAESLAQQTATADVLKVISSSPGELESVFNAMLENAVRICQAKFGSLYLFEADAFRAVATYNAPAAYSEDRKRNPVRPPPDSALGGVLKTHRVTLVPDITKVNSYVEGDPYLVTAVKRGGYRSIAAIPMLKDNSLVGAITINREEAEPFTDKQVELVQNFAAQAVIAIENARLLNELRESLQRQTATSEILTVISRSPTDANPVFEIIGERAEKLCDADVSVVSMVDNEAIQLASIHGVNAEGVAALRAVFPMQRDHETITARTVRNAAVVHVPDVLGDPLYEPKGVARAAGYRACLGVPMIGAGQVIGTIFVARSQPGPFADSQIELLKTFADQAVIAIGNVRLFDEVQARTRDLTESLEQQTATSEVLKVISSSPGELDPVFRAVLENAVKICDAKFGNLFLGDAKGLRIGATYGAPQAYTDFLNDEGLFVPNPEIGVGRMVNTKARYQVADLAATPTQGDKLREATIALAGARTLIGVPLLKEDQVVGAIIIYRQEVRPFTEKQIELVTNFAAQAVIAIENTRLLSELRDSLERQTATSDVLQVISASPGELDPVFATLLANATRLCEASYGALWLRDGAVVRNVAFHGELPAAFHDIWHAGSVIPAAAEAPVARCIELGRPIYVEDLREHQSYRDGNALARGAVDLGGIRTLIAIPLLKEGGNIGGITIYRREVRPFSEKQIELVTNFAAQAVIAIENTRLLRELRESLEQQTATSEVLKVISSSPGELQPVFDSMLENATRICEAKLGVLFLFEGDAYRAVAAKGDSFYAEWYRRDPVVNMKEVEHDGTPLKRLTQTKTTIHIHDLRADDAYIRSNPRMKALVETAGARTHLVVPMLKDEDLVGAIVIYRQEVRPFAEKQIALVQNFAAQAVIAIENTRLLNELRESLEQQTATSEVLRVISSSPGSLEPVFTAMLESAIHICRAQFGVLQRFVGDEFDAAATANIPPAFEDFLRRRGLAKAIPGSDMDRLTKSKQIVHTLDLSAEAVLAPPAKFGGARTQLAVPMLKDDELVGAFAIYRQEVLPFTDKQIELVKNFAAQAVIAVENARLLNELRESLEQQTATSEVLKVIASSAGELEPVFKAMLENANHICEANFGTLYLAAGNKYRVAAMNNAPSAFAELQKRRGWFDPTPDGPLDRVMRTKQLNQSTDASAEAVPGRSSSIGGARSRVCVPMLKDDTLVGAILIYRTEVRPFSDKQISLLQSFAAQAVIAIENARLLNELRESLQQQTATGEILASISGSLTDTKPVFDAIVRNLLRLFGTRFAVVQLLQNGVIHMPAVDGEPGFERLVKYYPRPLDDSTVGGVTMLAKKTIYLSSVIENPDAPPATQRFAEEFGFNSTIFAPMMRGDTVIGAIGVAHKESRTFDDKKIALIRAFADQAVIAIENVRLFDDVQTRTRELTESLEQQTAAADVLKVISRSAFDLQTVLDTLTASAARLCQAEMATITRQEGSAYYYATTHGFPKEISEYLKSVPHEPGRGSVIGRTVLEGKAIHVADVTTDPEYKMAEVQQKAGYRTVLGVPLLREGRPIGVIGLQRTTVRPFSEREIELVTTFADQAVIAIENVRLFDDVQARTNELAKSLEELQTAQDRLIQTEKLASLGQLTAGIAHEIKNPLNFVNNFSSISVELIDELREALNAAHLDDKLRAQVAEVTDMLQGNLDKVVQHGKRADSIVKNMLLHSRQGSGEHRPIDINAVVEESLNLAYHGARAEKQGFNITLERSFDPAAGEVDLFPQEITRVLLNLISNGFYAATKRKAESNGGGYEPTLAAATKNLGDSVEIRIRDNGTGIPPEVKEKMFNPFFTTKPAGEGTGLGLSLSYDIIVKQHAGTIEVDTRPGEFTEFRIVLPRGAASIAKSGGSA